MKKLLLLLFIPLISLSQSDINKDTVVHIQHQDSIIKGDSLIVYISLPKDHRFGILNWPTLTPEKERELQTMNLEIFIGNYKKLGDNKYEMLGNRDLDYEEIPIIRESNHYYGIWTLKTNKVGMKRFYGMIKVSYIIYGKTLMFEWEKQITEYFPFESNYLVVYKMTEYEQKNRKKMK